MKTTTAVVLFLLVQQAPGQAILSLDSLERQLVVANSDTTRVPLLIKIGSGYILSDPKTSERYYLQGLALSRKVNYKKGEADCLRLRSAGYRSFSTYFINNAFYR